MKLENTLGRLQRQIRELAAERDKMIALRVEGRDLVRRSQAQSPRPRPDGAVGDRTEPATDGSTPSGIGRRRD